MSIETKLKNKELECINLKEEINKFNKLIKVQDEKLRQKEDEIKGKDQNIKELKKTKKILSEKAAELKHSYIEP